MNAELTRQLVENHRQFLAFLERRVGDRALAEDILQDAFVKSLSKEDDVRDETSSVAWFYRMLRNSVVDHYRRSGTRKRALETLARELEEAVEPPPEIHDEICGCVSRLASTLKPEYEAAIRRIEASVGNSVMTVESVPAAVGIFVAAGGDPLETVVGGTNIGNDSDTIAAMAGSLAGALRGIAAVPADLVATVKSVNSEDIDGIAEGLTEIAWTRSRGSEVGGRKR